MSSGHVTPTTFTKAVQSLISAYRTAYFKDDEHKKDHEAQQQRMTPKHTEYSYVYSPSYLEKGNINL